MKVLLANQIGGLWRQVKTIGFESVSTPMAWLGLVAYSLQLYLDFCGYSWMAIGVGEMLASGCPGTSSIPTPPAPCGTSGAAGTSVSALGSGTMCISRWAAAKRGRAVPT